MTFLRLLPILLLVSTISAQQVQLQWDANTESDLSGYRLYRGLEEGGPYQLVGEVACGPDDVSCTTFTDVGLEFTTPYYYRATAFNSSGLESGFSNEAAAFILNPDAPAAPTGLLVSEQGVNVSARWSPVEGIDWYAVFYKGPVDEEFALVGVVSVSQWTGRLPAPGNRRGGQLGVASLNHGGYSALLTHTFR